MAGLFSEKARASKPAGVRLECASASASASEGLSSSAVDRSWRDLSSSAVDRSWRDPSSSTVNCLWRSVVRDTVNSICIIIKRSIFCGPLEKELRKRLMKCFVWSVVLCGEKTWTLRRNEEKHLKCGYGEGWSV
ncbi:hypothetical protein ANN_23586 [Periplaneta americana]|uniref:Uncharacterized protein n=1 Tax=Periplaneta americana TaxID=6978 RepID=A0ABQ8SLJ4_PERAM|nr:hypothetical protein ANN_23586 [Periplaneta americana]